MRKYLGKNDCELKKRNDYTPFGGSINALSSSAPMSMPNRYKLSGNEEQTDFNLNLYDFNARFYDAQIGRFISVDPLAADPMQYNQSPYQFSWNNPVTLNDPTGNCPRCPRPDKPMYAIAEGFRQMFDAAASFFSFKGTRSRKATDVVAESSTGNVSVTTKFEETSTKGFKLDFSGIFDVAADNTRVKPLQIFTIIDEDKSAVVTEVQTNIKVGPVPVQVTGSNETASDGSSEQGVKVNAGVSRGPAKAGVYVSGSTSTDSNGQRTNKVSVGANASLVVAKDQQNKREVEISVNVEVSHERRNN